MIPGSQNSTPLTPELDVEGHGVNFRALSAEPWLRLETNAERLTGRWIEITYDLGLTDRATRPILRFVTALGVQEEFIPAASLGRGIWRGRAPRGCQSISISPVDRRGPFSFRIVALRVLSLPSVIAFGVRKPKWLLFSLHCFILGDFATADRCLRRALATPISDPQGWTKQRRREPEAFDAVASEARTGRFRAFALGLDAASLARLSHPFPKPAGFDIVEVGGADLMRHRLEDLGSQDWFFIANSGLDWRAEAAAAFLAEAARCPADLVYADEIVSLGEFGGGEPRLKPDWSPALAHGKDYIGRAWAARVGWARATIEDWSFDRLVREGPPWSETISVAHVRRPLATAAAVQATPRPRRTPHRSAGQNATIIIPTRDGADLLARCIASLHSVPAGADFEIIVVDNGSTEPKAVEFLRALARQARTRVLPAAGEFNFSALCNEAAAMSRTETLVFLNNDTEARSEGWLATMSKWTAEPKIGAVGAKLLFPDGRIQHGGVVLGIDGHANHFERFAPTGAPGYFRRSDVAHEVSAVTGACLAVSRNKFCVVNGFDAVDFPVEFSDIDLCLRLRQQGWGSLMAPEAVLIHHEAATRKIFRSQEKRYAKQVATFKTRWRDALRDDPYFHPALSLDWHEAALG